MHMTRGRYEWEEDRKATMTFELVIEDDLIVDEIPRCGCTNIHCRVHLKYPWRRTCSRPSTTVLYRTDTPDYGGTLFCDDCAKDALSAGVFANAEAIKEG